MHKFRPLEIYTSGFQENGFEKELYPPALRSTNSSLSIFLHKGCMIEPHYVEYFPYSLTDSYLINIAVSVINFAFLEMGSLFQRAKVYNTKQLLILYHKPIKKTIYFM